MGESAQLRQSDELVCGGDVEFESVEDDDDTDGVCCETDGKICRARC